MLSMITSWTPDRAARVAVSTLSGRRPGARTSSSISKAVDPPTTSSPEHTSRLYIDIVLAVGVRVMSRGYMEDLNFLGVPQAT